ncbi:hypothetical protein ILYODFUR_000631 [Ilyodon furcidens]|uniref:Uncharacterized protein n=1 Tax=Ilyodon furcidens TaxID=33524 RepID=A0ABV0UPQ6_9TELE
MFILDSYALFLSWSAYCLVFNPFPHALVLLGPSDLHLPPSRLVSPVLSSFDCLPLLSLCILVGFVSLFPAGSSVYTLFCLCIHAHYPRPCLVPAVSVSLFWIPAL